VYVGRKLREQRKECKAGGLSEIVSWLRRKVGLYSEKGKRKGEIEGEGEDLLQGGGSTSRVPFPQSRKKEHSKKRDQCCSKRGYGVMCVNPPQVIKRCGRRRGQIRHWGGKIRTGEKEKTCIRGGERYDRFKGTQNGRWGQEEVNKGSLREGTSGNDELHFIPKGGRKSPAVHDTAPPLEKPGPCTRRREAGKTQIQKEGE